MKNQKAKGSISRFSLPPVALIICSSSFAQHPGWMQYTNGNEINALAASGNEIWVGTGGGLVKIDKISSIS